ncbi:MAG: arsenate reductase (glutaredoxin) [Planctomycetes bacterium]|nr:arsenate reductase (glutaredoxin) [Planctomycetota bacterium]
MPQVTIYHNPRCSKSRQTLSLLEEQGIDPEIVLYLETPPDEKTLRALIEKLGIEAEDLIRRKEYRELGLEETDDADDLVRHMAAHPQIIERPIVVVDSRARLGRPPESVLEIL